MRNKLTRRARLANRERETKTLLDSLARELERPLTPRPLRAHEPSDQAAQGPVRVARLRRRVLSEERDERGFVDRATTRRLIRARFGGARLEVSECDRWLWCCQHCIALCSEQSKNVQVFLALGLPSRIVFAVLAR